MKIVVFEAEPHEASAFEELKEQHDVRAEGPSQTKPLTRRDPMERQTE